MNREPVNRSIIARRKREVQFLEHFANTGYDLIDLPIIEQFDWSTLSEDDLRMMPNRYKWQQGDEVHSLRSDWTHALVRYRHKYHLPFTKLAYAGPVYTRKAEHYQFGVETYTEDVAAQILVLRDMINFVQNDFGIKLHVGVVGHNTLLKQLVPEAELNDKVTQKFIKERNRDALAVKLGEDNPIVEFMKQPAIAQVQYVKDNFPNLKKQIAEIDDWRTELQALNIESVHADMLALPTQSYYKGVFIQLYTENSIAPMVLGGQYSRPTKAFGMALNVD